MEIEFGYCHCGCGQKTSIASNTIKRQGRIKGQPVRFIHNHHCRGDRHVFWKNGTLTHGGRYREKSVLGNRFYEHREIAEKILGKPLPEGSCIHHYAGYGEEDKTKIVICDSFSYHQILHARSKAFKECGHASWRKCKYCHEYDDPKNLYLNPSKSYAIHRECNAKYHRERRKKLTQRRKQ